MIHSKYDIIIIGGGAAGFFTAINIAEKNPNLKIAILERGKEVLTKVKISGGGRCNVTHACYNPNELTAFYPRGNKELKGPFHQFCTGDTWEWFEKKGIALKTEPDGRIFPQSNSSQTIIDCFIKAAKEFKINIFLGQSVQSFSFEENTWKITTTNGNFSSNKLVLTTGGNPKIWEILHSKGHTVIPAVPSLFTFNCKDPRIKNLMGVSALVSLNIKDTKLKSSGPLLITHWGMSGPAILRLSAWGALILAEKKYQFTLQVNWLNDQSFEDTLDDLKEIKTKTPKKLVMGKSPFEMPNRLWESLVNASQIPSETKWADLSTKQMQKLCSQLVDSEFAINGKSTFKEEFVTAGGVDLKEVNFKTMESKILPNLYFAGEILNIDAITGGFNFQNAWTGGFIIANAIV